MFLLAFFRLEKKRELWLYGIALCLPTYQNGPKIDNVQKKCLFTSQFYIFVGFVLYDLI